MNTKRSLVSVVDDDESVCEALPDLLEQLGFVARGFASAEAFLESDCVDRTNCLILDVSMPGMSGPELQQELVRRHQDIPVVFITANRDEEIRLSLIENGAVQCLYKPFSEADLVEALGSALNDK